MSDHKDDAGAEPTRTTDEPAEATQTAKAKSANPDVDATGADRHEREAKDELFEAIDHFKNAASILFNRAKSDPAVRSVSKEAERVVRNINPAIGSAAREAERVVEKISDAVEPLAKQMGDAAEPIARQLTDEVGRLTRDVMSLVDGRRGKGKKRPARTDEEE